MSSEEVSAVAAGFLKNVQPELRGDALRIREALLGACHDLEEAIKWRRLTFTLAGNWHHWICGIGASKKAVALYFHKGALLADPQGLLSGDGKYTRLIAGSAFAAIDAEAFRRLMADAVTKQTLMLEGEG